MIISLQMRSTHDIAENLLQLQKLLEQIPSQRPLLVCLPECFACFPKADKKLLEIAQTQQSQHIIDTISEFCRRYDIWIAAGTMPIIANSANKCYAASILFNAAGEQIAQYNKIHLFDVAVADNQGQYSESKYTAPGSDIVVVDSPFGKLGLSVCYDLRFAALYNQLAQQGAEILLVPAAFTQVTGEAHWHTLLRARAIENQCYVVATNQVGQHSNGRHTFGHSLIIEPWGNIVAEITDNQPGILSYSPDLNNLYDIRQKMPVLQHNQFNNEFNHDK